MTFVSLDKNNEYIFHQFNYFVSTPFTLNYAGLLCLMGRSVETENNCFITFCRAVFTAVKKIYHLAAKYCQPCTVCMET